MVPTLVVSNHEVVKECFTTNDKAFASRPTSAAAKILGYDYAVFPFSPYGPLWREMRKLSVLELLSTIRSSGSTHLLVSELDDGIKDLYMLGKDNSWVNPQKVVMSEWFEHLTFNVILRMIVHGGTEEARSAIAAINKLIHLLGATVASDVIPFLEWVDLKGHLSSMKHVSKELDSLLQSWVDEHIGRLNSEASRRRDFIDVMLTKLKDASLFGYSRQTIIKATILVHIVFFFFFFIYIYIRHLLDYHES